jgi:hypothetical protein
MHVWKNGVGFYVYSPGMELDSVVANPTFVEDCCLQHDQCGIGWLLETG